MIQLAPAASSACPPLAQSPYEGPAAPNPPEGAFSLFLEGLVELLLCASQNQPDALISGEDAQPEEPAPGRPSPSDHAQIGDDKCWLATGGDPSARPWVVPYGAPGRTVGLSQDQLIPSARAEPGQGIGAGGVIPVAPSKVDTGKAGPDIASSFYAAGNPAVGTQTVRGRPSPMPPMPEQVALASASGARVPTGAAGELISAPLLSLGSLPAGPKQLDPSPDSRPRGAPAATVPQDVAARSLGPQARPTLPSGPAIEYSLREPVEPPAHGFDVVAGPATTAARNSAAPRGISDAGVTTRLADHPRPDPPEALILQAARPAPTRAVSGEQNQPDLGPGTRGFPPYDESAAQPAAGRAAQPPLQTSAVHVEARDGRLGSPARQGRFSGRRGQPVGEAAKPETADGASSAERRGSSWRRLDMPGLPRDSHTQAVAATDVEAEPVRPGLLGSHLAQRLAGEQRPGVVDLQVQLDPPSLGRVNLRLTIDAQNTVHATIRTELPAAVHALHAAVPEIRSSLESHGFHIASLGVGEGTGFDAGGGTHHHGAPQHGDFTDGFVPSEGGQDQPPRWARASASPTPSDIKALAIQPSHPRTLSPARLVDHIV